MNLVVPTTFTKTFVGSIVKLNSLGSGVRISDCYGSLPFSPIGSARPSINLPQVNISELETHVNELNRNGIRFRYLFNSPYSKMTDPRNNKIVANYIDSIIDILSRGKNELIVASDSLFQHLKKQCNLMIGISNVLNIRDKKILEYFVMQGAESVVLSTSRNRDFTFLQSLQDSIIKKIVLLGNESCLLACERRLNHYQLSSFDTSEVIRGDGRSSHPFIDTCMIKCTIEKFKDPSNFIKAPWIRPEDISFYEEVGISHIKLGDRTKPEGWLISCYEAYMKRKSPNNLFELLAITPKNITNERALSFPHVTIQNALLNDFLQFFYHNKIDCTECKRLPCDYCNQKAQLAVRIDYSYRKEFLKDMTSLEKELRHDR